MNAFRHHIRRLRWWAAVLIVAALFIEMLVPAGYMPSMTNGAFLMRPCARQVAPVIGVSDGAAHGDHNNGDSHKSAPDDDGHGKLEMPCAFSSLSAPALGMTDPILLAIAIAFILTAAFHLEARVERRRIPYLRPPSQGPPFA